MKTLNYGRHQITDQDIAAVVEVLKGDYLTQGPCVQAFEKAFAEYVGAQYAVAVSNGTAALHIGALALGVGKKSKVITTPITFAASANCIRYCKGQIDFVDIDPETLLIDLNKLRWMLQSAPPGTYEGIIPVDFAGYPVNLKQLRNIADEYDLWIMEDACHAPGAWFYTDSGTKYFSGDGAFAELSVFSFHPVKHIACGEGGMITTNDKKLYEKLLLLRSHGITKNPNKLSNPHGGWYYEMQTLGYNYRLSDMQAALGISQLKRAADGIDRRRAIAKRYDEMFANEEAIQAITLKEGIGHAYHLYIIQVENRKELYEELRSEGIYILP